MPSVSLQSRIQAFEALSSSSTTSSPTNRTSSLLESPISPTANAFQPITPSPSTPSLVCQTSFIDLKDWVVEDGPVEHHAPSRKLNGIHESSRTPSPSRKSTPTPLINFEPPPKSRPPLPPRKPSFITAGETLRPPGRLDTLTIEHTYPPGAHKFGARRLGHASASSVSSFHSVSLSSDGSNVETQSPKISSKTPSFALEVDSGATDLDTASIAESFENVSVPSAASPLTAVSFDWEQAISKSKTSSKLQPPVIKIPPVIPPKPLVRSVSASSSSTATSTKTRRPPPPPPPYHSRSRPSSSRTSVISTSTSDRSSILSGATTTSQTTSQTSISTRNSTQIGGGVKSSPLLRPTPVPSAARSRYESLFDSAVQGRRKAEKIRKTHETKLLAPPPFPAKKGRQAAGWRGLSVDLITNPEDHPVLSSAKGFDENDSEEEVPTLVAPEARLNGRIVKYIWNASRLDNRKLRSIWNECDPQCTGFVDRDAFVRGMWRIDEELRRAQLARRTSALAAASSQRIPHRPLPLPRPKGTTTLLT